MERDKCSRRFTLTNDVIVFLVPAIPGQRVTRIRAPDVEHREEGKHGRQDPGQSQQRLTSRQHACVTWIYRSQGRVAAMAAGDR